MTALMNQGNASTILQLERKWLVPHGIGPSRQAASLPLRPAVCLVDSRSLSALHAPRLFPQTAAGICSPSSTPSQLLETHCRWGLGVCPQPTPCWVSTPPRGRGSCCARSSSVGTKNMPGTKNMQRQEPATASRIPTNFCASSSAALLCFLYICFHLAILAVLKSIAIPSALRPVWLGHRHASSSARVALAAVAFTAAVAFSATAAVPLSAVPLPCKCPWCTGG